MSMSVRYLVSPPHHQVGEERDPTDGADERDWKEPFGRLEKNKKHQLKLFIKFSSFRQGNSLT